MMLSNEAEALLAGACRAAAARRRIHCGAEQLLETLLRESGQARAAAPLSEFLDAQPRLPFEPPRAELSRLLRERVLPCAGRLGGSEVSIASLRDVLLGEESPLDPALRREVARRLAEPEPTPVAPDGSRARQVTADELLVTLDPVEADGLVDRPELVDRLATTLRFSSALLVGPVGSGRRSLVRLLARRLSGGEKASVLPGSEVYLLDPWALVAGTSYRGELEERVQRLLGRLSGRPHPPVLVIDDLARLLEAGGAQSGSTLAAAFIPVLKTGRLRLAGSVSQDQVREVLEQVPDFLERFVRVPVEPPDVTEARLLIASLPKEIEGQHGVAVAEEALDAVLRLCREHLPHRALPGSAVTLLRGAAATLAFESDMLAIDPGRAASPYWSLVGSPDTALLGPRHLIVELSRQHRIPIDHLKRGMADKLRALDAEFSSQIFGQDQVLEPVRRAVKVAMTGLADPRRPRGRLFFLGPPGTGKTECARLIARFLMGSEENLLRFDMSEFSDRSAVATLIGSDKGLVGSDEGGRLTEPLRENPHRVVLFDEIEKADPQVFHLLLQILDNGEIHDKRGCAVSFRHALCLFTSNAGCDAGLPGEEDRAGIVARLGRVFRPEFLDRIETFVVFKALDDAARRRVARFQLERLAVQLQEVHGAELSWSDAVLDRGMQAPPGESGARCVLRWIQSEVKPAVVDALLAAREPSRPLGVLLGTDEEGRLSATAVEREPCGAG